MKQSGNIMNTYHQVQSEDNFIGDEKNGRQSIRVFMEAGEI